MTKALVLVANGSEEMEAVITIDVLRRASWQVTVAAVNSDLTLTCSRGVRIQADAHLHAIDADTYDIIILPGGKAGAEQFAADEDVQALLKTFDQAGKTIAAICAAPLALHAADLLRHRQYTCYPGIESDITTGKHCNQRLVQDENIVTSQGPGTAFEFALALVAKFQDQQAADTLHQQMVLS